MLLVYERVYVYVSDGERADHNEILFIKIPTFFKLGLSKNTEVDISFPTSKMIKKNVSVKATEIFSLQ